METIKKIQNLNNAESFLQVNFLKGYKYIDKAGEIVNYFHKNNTEPKFSMNLQGLDIFEPEKGVDAIKITPKTFWAHFLQPGSFEQVESSFSSKFIEIIHILGIEKVSRIGWRNYFVYEFSTDKQREEALRKFLPIHNTVFEDITFKSSFNKVDLIVKIKKVTRNDSTELSGLLIDIDSYQKYEEFLDAEKLSIKLQDLMTSMKSDEMLQLINDILSCKDEA